MRWSCVLACVLVWSRVASAAPDPIKIGPWADGVSEEARTRAMELYDRGNQHFANNELDAAIAAYQGAVEQWSHPQIQFSIAVVFVRMDRVLEAADALDAAARYGADPYTPERYSSLLDYRKLVMARVGTLDVSCTRGTAQLFLDGKVWFSCPDKRAQRVLTGPHVVYVAQSGYASRSQDVFVTSDTPTHVNVDILSDEEAYEEVRRFPSWLPPSLMGAGAVAVVGGVLLILSGENKMSEYDQVVARECAVNGCDREQLEQFADLKDSAEFRWQAGAVTTIAGGAALIGGFAMLLMNRPTRRLRVDLAPTSGGANVGARWRF